MYQGNMEVFSSVCGPESEDIIQEATHLPETV